MTAGAIVALGVGQCVNWGVLYYAFAVLTVPLQQELGVPSWIVTGAFSLALLMSAMVAPAIGKWGDRDRGATVMQVGGFAAAALLIVWTLMPTVLTLYLVWAGLGLCMAATLYEPAFVLVGRAYRDPAARLRAIAAITLFGGLASTVFLPVTAFAVAASGWRNAVLMLAVLLVVSTVVTRAMAFHRRPSAPSAGIASSEGADDQVERSGTSQHFLFIATTFSVASLASAALAANLVPAMGEHGVTPSKAALLGGLLGVMQLPGRALLMSGTLQASPCGLLTLILVLHACGLGLVAFSGSTLAAAGGMTLFALGAGLTTLVRPHLIQTIFRADQGGYLNGRIARRQQLARASGPILVAWLASVLGYGAVLAGLGATFVILALASWPVLGGLNNLEREIL
jgi:MFS family permease